jgi:hypothetical protein
LMRLKRKSNLTRFCEIYAACREIGARRLYLVAKPEFSTTYCGGFADFSLHRGNLP